MSSKPDQPNAPRHAALAATWREGQRWETLVDGAHQWSLVGANGFAQPTWDANQEYRMVPKLGGTQCGHCSQLTGFHGYINHLNTCPEVAAR